MSPVRRKVGRGLLAGLFVCGLFAFITLGMMTIAGQPMWNPLVRSQADHIVKAFPQKLGPVEALLFGTTPGPIEVSFLSFIGGESCGGGIFRISSEVARQIEREGLSFFDGMEQGRSREGDPRKGVRYKSWQQTPIPEDWNDEGTYTRGFHCMDPPRDLYDLMRNSTSVPESYFSSTGSAQILVLPKSQIVVFTFSD